MYILNEQQVQRVVRAYCDVALSDAENGDSVFSLHGPGNVFDGVERPYERFSDYEELLGILKEKDPEKFKAIHKGTPFFFLAWTAYDLRNFEQALFYLDAGIAEDIKNCRGDWRLLPASQLLKLTLPARHSAERVTRLISCVLEAELTRFNIVSGRPTICLTDFVSGFVEPLFETTPKLRSVVTAFYTFLLEYEDRCRQLSLRSTEGGSLEPFITHLFKGGLLFESLLKHVYRESSTGNPYKTLGQIFQDPNFKADFVKHVEASSGSLRDVYEAIINDSLQTAFNTTAKLRNTTGHNLVWDDVFDETIYESLVDQEINAILHVVAQKIL